MAKSNRCVKSSTFAFAVLVIVSLAIPSATCGGERAGDDLNTGLPGVEDKTVDVSSGLELARVLCKSCHLIGEAASSPVQADVPSFEQIADAPNQNTESLTRWLIAPHAPMPDLHLTRKEIRDLAGYILSLRGRNQSE
jgi:mono/diheme cytochrome c family protein